MCVQGLSLEAQRDLVFRQVQRLAPHHVFTDIIEYVLLFANRHFLVALATIVPLFWNAVIPRNG